MPPPVPEHRAPAPPPAEPAPEPAPVPGSGARRSWVLALPVVATVAAFAVLAAVVIRPAEDPGQRLRTNPSLPGTGSTTTAPPAATAEVVHVGDGWALLVGAQEGEVCAQVAPAGRRDLVPGDCGAGGGELAEHGIAVDLASPGRTLAYGLAPAAAATVELHVAGGGAVEVRTHPTAAGPAAFVGAVSGSVVEVVARDGDGLVVARRQVDQLP